ncbi:MAG: hypothetical protein WCX16_02325, partial [Candidatus Omnitrophota bacterium]
LESFLIVVLLLTLPPFQITVCQGGMAFYPMSILVSLLSFILCFNAPEKKNILTYCSFPILSAVLLMVASLSIFQPGAMFFWALAAIFILCSRQEGFSRFWIKISKIFFVGFLGMVAYRVLLELVKKFFFHNVLGQDNSPYVVTNNLFAKVMWYLADPTIKVLNFWNIIPRKEYAFCFVLFVAGAMLLAVIQKGRKGLLGYKTREGIFKLFALLALFLLASLPNLLFPSNVSFYRCYMALSAFCVFIFLWALTTYTSFLLSTGRIIRILILVILVCFGTFQAYQTTFRYRAFPSAEELKFLQESLQAADLSQFSRVYFVQPDQKNLYTSDDEYGNLTTRFSNDIIGFFSCGIRSLMRDSYKIHYIDYDPFSGKTLYLFRKKEEWDPSSSYRVILSFGPEVKTQADFFEPTLIIDMNKVVDRIVQK